MGADKFQKIATADHMQLAYELAGLTQHPDADGLYIGGGSWLSEPVCQARWSGNSAGQPSPTKAA